MDKRQEHLGDGVYVEFDGYSVILKANSHETPTDTICLEPFVIAAFERWLAVLKADLTSGK
jgi:hypothetical protein